MSDIEGSLVECDKCQKQVEKSKIIQDKGADYPELIKKAKGEGRDFVRLCPLCADIDMINEDENELDAEISNIRQFL